MFRIGIRALPQFRSLHSTRAGLGLFGKSNKPLSTAEPSSAQVGGSNSAAAKIASRIPKWLRPYTSNFVNAPFSHVTAFVILHELSAIVPLIGLWYVFHQNHEYIPLDLPNWAIEKGTAVIDKGLALFDFSEYSVQEKAKFLMEGAYAYAITKALFPLRIVFSAALMPWFAKWFVVPFTKLFTRLKKKEEVPVTVDTKLEPEVKTKKIEKPRL